MSSDYTSDTYLEKLVANSLHIGDREWPDVVEQLARELLERRREEQETQPVALTAQLAENTKIWHELKMILSKLLLWMPESDEKQRLIKFVSENWPGHAPRSREIATMTSERTKLMREIKRLKKLLQIPTTASKEKSK